MTENSEPLKDRVLQLLAVPIKEGIPLATIATRSGVNYKTLDAFVKGRTECPSGDFLQTLFEHLTGRPLLKEKENV